MWRRPEALSPGERNATLRPGHAWTMIMGVIEGQRPSRGRDARSRAFAYKRSGVVWRTSGTRRERIVRSARFVEVVFSPAAEKSWFASVSGIQTDPPPLYISPLQPIIAEVSSELQEAPAPVLIPAGALEIATVRPTAEDPVSVYLAQLSPNSRRAVRHDLDVIAGLLSDGESDAFGIPWHLLRYPHTAAIRQQLAEQYAPSSANRMLSSLRGVLREAWNLELVSAEDFHRAVSIKAIKGSRLPAGRALTAGEIRALFTACAEDPRPAGVRDAAIIAVLYGGGVRRAELVQLDLSDYTIETGATRVRSGKGNKERITYVQGMGCTAVEVWLQVRGSEPGALFLPIHRSGKIQMRPMREQSVYDMLQRRAREAGVPPFSPHDLRRTFAGDLLDAGADISTVQKLMGHASVNTTQGYDRRGEATKRKTASLLHIPYNRPA